MPEHSRRHFLTLTGAAAATLWLADLDALRAAGRHAATADAFLVLSPADAARLLNARFASPLVLGGSPAPKLPDTLSRLGIAGGAVYDALVALAAKQHGIALATRDARARGTYDTVGVEVIVVT